jgi:hypothetical protein
LFFPRGGSLLCSFGISPPLKRRMQEGGIGWI